MTRRKKQLEYPEIKIPHEVFIGAINNLDFPLNEIAKARNLSLDELNTLFDEYHNALDLKLEQDKQKRRDLKKYFREIERGLKELRESVPKLPLKDLSLRDLPLRNYCEVNIGGKWVNPEPKLLGAQSFITEQIKNGESGREIKDRITEV